MREQPLGMPAASLRRTRHGPCTAPMAAVGQSDGQGWTAHSRAEDVRPRGHPIGAEGHVPREVAAESRAGRGQRGLERPSGGRWAEEHSTAAAAGAAQAFLAPRPRAAGGARLLNADAKQVPGSAGRRRPPVGERRWLLRSLRYGCEHGRHPRVFGGLLTCRDSVDRGEAETGRR